MFAILVATAAAAMAQTTIADLEARVAKLEGHEHESEHDHGHGHGGGGDWEWSGVYELGSGSYTWKFNKNAKGVYGAPDESMQVVVLRAGDMSSDAILTNMHAAAEAIFNGAACTKVLGGGMLTPADRCFELWFDAALNTTSFTLDVLAAGRFAIYTAHVPAEFGAVKLGTPAGLEAGPLATLSHEALHEDHEHEQDEMVLIALIIAIVGTFLALCALVATVLVWRCHSHRGQPVSITTRQTREIPMGLSGVSLSSATPRGSSDHVDSKA